MHRLGSGHKYRWAVKLDGAVIAQGNDDVGLGSSTRENATLVAKLMSAGWEVVTADKYGNVKFMRRLVR